MTNHLLQWPLRTSAYCLGPASYSIQCDHCGGGNIEWSEWDKLIWCYDCEIDTEGTEGIFGAPIPAELAKMMGLSFQKIKT